ncbi:MAG: hypothetical protein JWN10_1851, partial [Solirubrobacterales bacterium]|nr:hypothetical protein [Solirubrobacterales bacterium]
MTTVDAAERLPTLIGRIFTRYTSRMTSGSEVDARMSPEVGKVASSDAGSAQARKEAANGRGSGGSGGGGVSLPDGYGPPLVIAGIGGSGTRVAAQLLIELGFYLGEDLNPALDNLTSTFLFKRPRWYGRAAPRQRRLDAA